MSYESGEASVYGGKPVELYRFARGAEIWRYTSADGAQEYNGETYLPEVISRTPVDQSNEDSAGSVTITVPRDHEVAALFISYLPIEPVELRIFRFHRGDAEVKTIFVGKIVSAAFEGSEATLVAMPISEVFRRSVPFVVYQSPCNHALYGPGCGLDRELFKVPGTVAAVAADGTYIDSAELAGYPAGRFRAGYVRRADGELRMIADFSIVGPNGRVFLVNPFRDVVTGEALEFFPGCDRTETTCETVFSNLPNHLGWARIPTKNPFNTDLSGTGGSGAAGGSSSVPNAVASIRGA